MSFFNSLSEDVKAFCYPSNMDTQTRKAAVWTGVALSAYSVALVAFDILPRASGLVRGLAGASLILGGFLKIRGLVALPIIAGVGALLAPLAAHPRQLVRVIPIRINISLVDAIKLLLR